jgi:hypothetical protein
VTAISVKCIWANASDGKSMSARSILLFMANLPGNV